MFELWLFTADARLAAQACGAGVGGIVLDWECVGKEDRQRGADLECNHDTLADVAAVRAAVGARVVCRINAYGARTREEVELAVTAGVDLLLLPMVRTPDEVSAYLDMVAGRARAGILVETAEAVARAKELAALPVDCAYVGLNDLGLARGSRDIFAAIVDGTVERVREAFAGTRFGFGGVTVVDGGRPVPCRLLMAEMSRIGCDFGFLRRSFKHDVRGRDMAAEVARIQREFARMSARTQAEVAADRDALRQVLAGTAAAAEPEPRVDRSCDCPIGERPVPIAR